MATRVHGFDAWENAIELESFTMKWVTKGPRKTGISSADLRKATASSSRDLHVQYGGDNSKAVAAGGVRRQCRG